MSQLKIAVIGAGSYVFGPGVLQQVVLEQRLNDAEIALVDPAADVVELTAAVGNRMAREAGLNTTFTAHTTRGPALDGASFVLCSAAVQIKKRFQMDTEIAHKHMPDHLLTEFGGVCGISGSLRQIALIEEICADILKHAPNAWLFNTANPLPRVCQAAHESGVKTVGFCSVSLLGYQAVGRILDREDSKYPFKEQRDHYDAVMAGVNHLTWIVDLFDRTDGSHALPALRGRVRAGATGGNPRCERILKETGYLITSGDHHSMDFLPPDPLVSSLHDSSHGSSEDRTERLQLLRDITEGRRGWEPLFQRQTWEKPIELVNAIANNKPTRFHALNLINKKGHVKNLPKTAFVETPAGADARDIFPDHIELPDTVVPYCMSAVAVTEAIVRAAKERSRSRLREAVELDPTITDKSKGIAAIEECLTAHADLLPTYS